MTTFRALLATRENDQFDCRVRDLPLESLPPGEVLIRVAYSSLNYKDGLAVSGRPGVIRKFPMVPGIDLAGTVVESASPELRPGAEVVVTGCGLAETVWGGYAQYARVEADWVIPLPSGLTLQRAMAAGTAGFTAMQSVLALEEHGLAPGGPRQVVVTGAAGGVGSCAVAMLAKLGYPVAAVTGRPELTGYLQSLGAAAILEREAIAEGAAAGLASERWAGAIDTVGGALLAGLLPCMAKNSSVACCGLAGGEKLHTTVYPLILRGVNLLGINSGWVGGARRRDIWWRLVRDLPAPLLDSMTAVEPLERIFELSQRILQGRVRGRVVIDVNA